MNLQTRNYFTLTPSSLYVLELLGRGENVAQCRRNITSCSDKVSSFNVYIFYAFALNESLFLDVLPTCTDKLCFEQK